VVTKELRQKKRPGYTMSSKEAREDKTTGVKARKPVGKLPGFHLPGGLFFLWGWGLNSGL
jgi:hypothetical protein